MCVQDRCGRWVGGLGSRLPAHACHDHQNGFVRGTYCLCLYRIQVLMLSAFCEIAHYVPCSLIFTGKPSKPSCWEVCQLRLGGMTRMCDFPAADIRVVRWSRLD
jgi:hypothetical protein